MVIYYFHSISETNIATAFTFDNPPTADKCVTPAALRAPEIVLRNNIDHKVDIWSFGCLLYELLTGNVLFQVSGLTDIPQEENDDDHLLQMIDTLGQPPPEIFARWSRHAKYFDKNLKLIRSDVSLSDFTGGDPFRGPSLEEAFEESRPEGMDAEECAHVLGLLRKTLQYQPDLRPSTAGLLDDEWFRSIE